MSASQVNFQLVCLYTDFYSQRKLRVINLSLEVVEHINSYYGSLDPEAVFYLMARRSLDQIRVTPRNTLRVTLVENLRDILKAFREESNEVNSQEMTVPKSIDSILICVHSLIRGPVRNPTF